MHNTFSFDDLPKKEMQKLLKAYQEAVDFNLYVSITDREGTIIYVNDKFCETSKYSKEELIGQTHRIVNSGHHSKAFFKDLWETIIAGNTWRGDVKCKAKDGTYFWQDSTIIPIFDDDGKIKQFFSIRMPIDERKELKEKRDEYTKNLEELIWMTSHEVRKPLATCLGLMDLIESDLEMSREELKNYLAYLKPSILDLDNFVRNLTTKMDGLKQEDY